jgi:hydrogenase expression/formation protein HypE
MRDRHITLAHGNGGRRMRELIEEIFARHLGNPSLDIEADAVPLDLPQGEPVFTTDGFIVQPLEFPGGDIGSLAVHGTCNDLAVAGATPQFLSLNAFIEEGLEIELLERIVASIGRTARESGVPVVAGDTKVLPRGQGGGLYLATSGIGIRPPALSLGMDRIEPGDRLLVSGPVGDHGIAVMLAREQFGLRGELLSDAANVLPFTSALLQHPGLRFMRDPTRGGLATVAHEISRSTSHQVILSEAAIPVRDSVRSVCDILGYDPLFLPCEGRVVAVVEEKSAQKALELWRSLPGGAEAAMVGEITESDTLVILETELGGRRILEELEEDPLPRIC